MSTFHGKSEKDVGITLYLGKHPRFSALVKQRYSDFHVNEIDMSGNIVHLTSLDPPVDNELKVALNDPEIASLVEDSVRNRIASLQESLTQTSYDKKAKKETVEINVTNLDKESRTKVHKWIARFDKLSSETLDKGTDKLIKVVPMTANLRNSRRPANRAKYTHCIMYKEGVETSEAIGFIAKKLNLKPSLISYAGIKDKRAKTAQRISVSNIDASRLVGICKHHRGMKLGNFEYQDRPISLGDLKGNHFKLLLKEVNTESVDVIENAINSFKTVGFVNYFGLQRFGTFETSTYEIGKKILQQNWLEAFDLILKIKPNDRGFMVRAKKLWLNDRNAEGAHQEIPPGYRSIETHLFHGLSRFYTKNDFVTAFTRIPRHVRLLYLHSYQSFLWNRVVSYRIEEYGMKPVVGDLVYLDTEAAADGFIADGVNIDEVGELVEDEPVVAAHNTQYRQKFEVKVLDENDIKEGKYSIYDVLIPIHGTEIKQCQNKTKDFLLSLMKEDGIEEDAFLRYKPVTDGPKGAYRKIVVLPKNVSHRILKYSDDDSLDSFIPSDLDLLQKSCELLNESKPEDSTETKTNTNESEERVKNKTCVILEFSLPSSCYATMGLREILEEVPSVTEEEKSPQDDTISDKSEEPDTKKPRIE